MQLPKDTCKKNVTVDKTVSFLQLSFLSSSLFPFSSSSPPFLLNFLLLLSPLPPPSSPSPALAASPHLTDAPSAACLRSSFRSSSRGGRSCTATWAEQHALSAPSALALKRLPWLGCTLGLWRPGLLWASTRRREHTETTVCVWLAARTHSGVGAMLMLPATLAPAPEARLLFRAALWARKESPAVGPSKRGRCDALVPA